MQGKARVQAQSRMRLDFFPCHSEVVPTKTSYAKLTSSGARTACFALRRDAHFYVQCNCACK